MTERDKIAKHDRRKFRLVAPSRDGVRRQQGSTSAHTLLDSTAVDKAFLLKPPSLFGPLPSPTFALYSCTSNTLACHGCPAYSGAWFPD